MDPASQLPTLLGLAWLAPLVSFVAILFFGPRMGHHGRNAAWVATAAIVTSLLLSLAAFGTWLAAHPVTAVAHGSHAAEADGHAPDTHAADAAHVDHGDHGDHDGHASPSDHHDGHHAAAVPAAYAGDWYTLYQGGSLRLSIGWYIDALTVLMFVVVTFIATCIHIYASGYMHDELHDVTDHEVHLADGSHLHRPGRFPRFFQALSLFCFSMLGIVIAGNLVMVFIFWELVGICSWFLIGFYFERKSASTAANKAFIVNRVGDFGMLIGLMALWGALGTLHFADSTAAGVDGHAAGSSQSDVTGVDEQVARIEERLHIRLAKVTGAAYTEADDARAGSRDGARSLGGGFLEDHGSTGDGGGAGVGVGSRERERACAFIA
jgi:NADH-quinone oxidoreductase subunit L